MTDEQRMISQLAERKITVFVKNQTFEQHSVFTHFHSCNLNLYLKKTRLIAHTYTQRHRSKRKEKTYTKAVITHTLHTPSGNSKTNSQWLLHQHDSSACDRTLEHANTCVGVITCVWQSMFVEVWIHVKDLIHHPRVLPTCFSQQKTETYPDSGQRGCGGMGVPG